MRFTSALHRLVDVGGLVATPAVAAISKLQARLGPQRLPLSYRVWDRLGVTPLRHHYYQPFVDPRTLPERLWQDEDPMLGVDLRPEAQLELLGRFAFEDELRRLAPTEVPGTLRFHYDNDAFGPGDAEILYSMVRSFRPRRIIEVGAGHSSRLIHEALEQNRAEGAPARHVCIEPFEMKWLERLGVDEVKRVRVEEVPLETFRELGENDILFIDSSHVVRIGGDVTHELLRIVPALAPGVIVHVHDVFLPFEYPKPFITRHRRFWTEQYLLQAFLAFNAEFEVLLALAYLARHHRAAFDRACPAFAAQPDRSRLPGSFWFRRKPA